MFKLSSKKRRLCWRIKTCSNWLIDVIEDDSENHNYVSEDSFIELYIHYNDMISKNEKIINTHIKNKLFIKCLIEIWKKK